MQRTMLVAAAVALVALAGVGGAVAADAVATQDEEEMVTVELVVTTPDGDPIDDAEVSIEGVSETWDTSANGRVYVDVPAGTDPSITLTHDEYVKNVPHEFSDASSGQTVEATMYPPATGEISVVDSEGSAVEGATVRFQKLDQNVYAAQGETGADGVFTSEEVESGTYFVSVQQPGYYDESSTVELSGESNATVAIEQGEVTIELFVQDPTPEGPGPVSADVAITRGDERVISATTNDQGHRSVALDVNRNYDIEVTKDGYRTLSTGLRTGESEATRTFNVTRTPAISLTAGNERVVVGENLRVEVTDEYDRPVEGATVLVGGEEAGQTDADGVARVEIPSEGDVEVGAEYDGRSADSATVTGISGSTDDTDMPATDGDEANDTNDSEEDGDDGGTGDGSPGFGVVAALFAAIVAVVALARRS